MALMSQDDLADLAAKDDVQLMAHELAHQWWGVTLGIRSWSDFWFERRVCGVHVGPRISRSTGGARRTTSKSRNYGSG